MAETGSHQTDSTIERDVTISLETLGQFVPCWLMRTDPIAEGEREIADALGQRRFEYFIDRVARKVPRGGGLGHQFALTAEATDRRDVKPQDDMKISSPALPRW